MKNFKFTPFEAVLSVIVLLLIGLLGIMLYPIVTYILGG